MRAIPDECPSCGLVLLFGAILDAAGEKEKYGPILGIDKDAQPATAKAGYVGIGSIWMYDKAPELYRCPRYHNDPIVVER